MRSVLRMRHYCDFCKKAGGSSYHMQRHEKSCTLNPGRVCRLSERLSGGNPAEMAEMLALLPDPALYQTNEGMAVGETRLDDAAITPVVEAAMPALRELVEDCPICILAALRQKKIPVPIVDSFDFKKELANVWDGIRQEEREYY
ncbi:MAG: hypothetical protein V4757_07385 [Pseudomonadota bacterium]